MDPPQPLDGQDLTPLLAGELPEQTRDHFTVGYDRHVLTRDDRHALMARNDGAGPKLFDLRNDPAYARNIAEENPEIVKRMFEEYVIPDAGGSPPRLG